MLVTGLDGFTGMHLGPVLQQRGYEVIRGAQPEFDLLRPDLMTAAVEAANPDFVIHLAGISFVAHDNAAALYAVNTVGTTSFLKALEPMAARLRKVDTGQHFAGLWQCDRRSDHRANTDGARKSLCMQQVSDGINGAHLVQQAADSDHPPV